MAKTVQIAFRKRKNNKVNLNLMADGRLKCLGCGKVDYPYYNRPICAACGKTHSYCHVTKRVLPLSEFYPGHLSECKEAVLAKAKAKKRARKTSVQYIPAREVAKELLRKELGVRSSK